jgi:hypothetical protein
MNKITLRDKMFNILENKAPIIVCTILILFIVGAGFSLVKYKEENPYTYYGTITMKTTQAGYYYVSLGYTGRQSNIMVSEKDFNRLNIGDNVKIIEYYNWSEVELIK